MCISCYCDNKLTKEPLRMAKKNKLPMGVSACESFFRNKKVQLKNQDRSKNSTVRDHLVDRITAHLLFTKASQHGFLIGFPPLLSLSLTLPKGSILWNDLSVSAKGRTHAGRGTSACDICCSMEHNSGFFPNKQQENKKEKKNPKANCIMSPKMPWSSDASKLERFKSEIRDEKFWFSLLQILSNQNQDFLGTHKSLISIQIRLCVSPAQKQQITERSKLSSLQSEIVSYSK